MHSKIGKMAEGLSSSNDAPDFHTLHRAFNYEHDYLNREKRQIFVLLDELNEAVQEYQVDSFELRLLVSNLWALNHQQLDTSGAIDVFLKSKEVEKSLSTGNVFFPQCQCR